MPKRKPPELVPNVAYPQVTLSPKPNTPSNPRTPGPSLDDVVPHSFIGPDRKKPKQEPQIPTDDANGYRPSLPPDQKPKLDRANRLAVDRPVRRLKNLHLDRVDLVTAGANQKAFVTLHKFEKASDDQRDKYGVDLGQDKNSYPIANVAQLKDAIQSIGRAGPNRSKVISHIKSRAAALGASDLIPDTFKSLDTKEGDIVENQVAKTTTEAEVEPIDSGNPDDVQKGKPSGTNNRKDVPAGTSADFGTDDGVDTGAIGGKKKKAAGALQGRAEEATSKSLDEPRRTRTRVERVAKSEYDQIQKALQETAKVNKELSERVEKMENERLEGEFIAKAKNLSNLGSPTEVGRLMLSMHKSVDNETYQGLERLLKAANAQLEKGELFATLGREDVENPTVMDRITELAKQKLQAGTAKTIEIAKMEVLHENPDLRDEYQNARRS